MASSEPHSHIAAIATTDTCTLVHVHVHCPGETGLPWSVFQAVSEMSLVLPHLNYLSSVGLSGRKHCSLVHV